MKNIMQVEVVSNEESIYEGEAEFAVIPTVNGELGIYPRHEPVMSLVRAGALRLKVPNQQEEVLVAVAGGVLEVLPHKITVLANIAIRAQDMDEAGAAEAKKQAETNLKQAQDPHAREKAEAALEAAIAQLKTLDYIRNRKH